MFLPEYGAVDVDGEILHQSSVNDDDIVTLDNGCICCTINENLVSQVKRVVQLGTVDHLFIETSGLACPQPILDSLEVVESLAFVTHIDGVLTVVDGTSFDASHYKAEAAKLQVEAADVVLLTKSDLSSSAAGIDAAEAAVRALLPHPSTPIIRTNHGEVPISLVTGIAPRELESRSVGGGGGEVPGRGHLAQDGIEVYIYRAERAFDPVAFERYVQEELPRSVIRAKGLVWLQARVFFGH